MIKCQFSYCPLIWMFSSRMSNNLINKVHERSLRIMSDDKQSDFQTLLENHNQLTFQRKSLQAFNMIQVYKILNGYAPPIMENLFAF